MILISEPISRQCFELSIVKSQEESEDCQYCCQYDIFWLVSKLKSPHSVIGKPSWICSIKVPKRALDRMGSKIRRIAIYISCRKLKNLRVVVYLHTSKWIFIEETTAVVHHAPADNDSLPEAKRLSSIPNPNARQIFTSLLCRRLAKVFQEITFILKEILIFKSDRCAAENHQTQALCKLTNGVSPH